MAAPILIRHDILNAGLDALPLHPTARAVLVSADGNVGIAGGAPLSLVLGEEFRGSDVDVFQVGDDALDAMFHRVSDLIRALLQEDVAFSVVCTA